METKNQTTQRPPIVVVMGHIDHGKTSLLLSIRKLTVPAGKPGGAITQHIGAYQVEKDGHKITFLDTPGHEAFSLMRQRGAKVADVALLLVASDEGVRPQTKEALSHIKEVKIPFIVALNKIDKPQADPEKVKRELAKEDVLVESMGGKVPSVLVSAKTGRGIEELLELILLLGEMEGLKTDLLAVPEGVVIESYLDPQRGAVATLILEQGQLKPGQVLGTNSTLGKIKALEDFQGNPLSKALPSQPVSVLGFEKPPQVGQKVKIFPGLEQARAGLTKVSEKTAPQKAEAETDKRALNLILKADFLGSVQALEDVLKNIPQEKVGLKVLKAEVGQISESDIKLASQTKAVILGFRVKVNSAARSLLQREKVRVLLFEVIYDLVEEVRKYMEKLLEPEVVKRALGKVKVLVVFTTEKGRQIVGGRITQGQVQKGALIEVFRKEDLLGRGKIVNLQRNKKDINLAQKGEEVGVLYEGEGTIEVGDTLVVYQEEAKKGEL